MLAAKKFDICLLNTKTVNVRYAAIIDVSKPWTSIIVIEQEKILAYPQKDILDLGNA